MSIVRVDVSNGSAIVIGWVGGACDSDDAIAFAATASGESLRIGLHAPPLPCGGAAVGRGLRVHLAHPIDASAIATSYGT